MTDSFQGEYSSFSDLTKGEQEGRDFVVEMRLTDSPISIIAPHGGRIEPGTFTLAEAIAGSYHSFYGFQGIKPLRNRKLHLTSALFDDPRALAVAHRADTVITIHGCQGDTPLIILGGADKNLSAKLLTSFRHIDIPARSAVASHLRGVHPDNLCNRGRSGKGVQLEFSRCLRDQLITPLDCAGQRRPTPLFYTLVGTIQTVLADVSHGPLKNSNTVPKSE